MCDLIIELGIPAVGYSRSWTFRPVTTNISGSSIGHRNINFNSILIGLKCFFAISFIPLFMLQLPIF